LKVGQGDVHFVPTFQGWDKVHVPLSHKMICYKTKENRVPIVKMNTRRSLKPPADAYASGRTK